MKTSIGGDRLGSGNKQNVSLKNYSRSTHDLSYLWRSSMASGTLVPFMNEVALPGDSFDIDLNCEVLTLPTVGPLFGSYKVQLDVFEVPVRLYNAKLHMNKLGIGMDMSNIMLPQMKVEAFGKGSTAIAEDNEQINPSCLFSYLGIRGIGKIDAVEGTRLSRHFNAVPYLGYWDIYKNYYANKQEENGYMIHVAPGVAEDYIIQNAYSVSGTGIKTQILTVPKQGSIMQNIEVTLSSGVGNPNWTEVTLEKLTGSGAGVYNLTSSFQNFTVNGLTGFWSNVKPGVFVDGDYKITAGQSIGSNVSPSGDTQPQLASFPLENIDGMREEILAQVRLATPFIVDEGVIAPYGNPFKRNDTDKLIACEYVQEGLAIKTYQSDLFNNWISTEWIDGTNGINEITSVDTTGDSFTIDSLNLANKVYNMLNRIAISGGTCII